MPVSGWTGPGLGAGGDNTDHAHLHRRIGLLRRYAVRIGWARWAESKFRPYLAADNARHAELHHRDGLGGS